MSKVCAAIWKMSWICGRQRPYRAFTAIRWPIGSGVYRSAFRLIWKIKTHALSCSSHSGLGGISRIGRRMRAFLKAAEG